MQVSMVKFKRQKILTAIYIIAVAITASAITSGFSYNKFKEILLNEATQKVTATRDTNKRFIEESYDRVASALISTAVKSDTANIIREFEEALYLVSPSFEFALKKVKKELARTKDQIADDSRLYLQIHAKRHPEFMRVATSLGLDNILLIEASKGFVIYSTKIKSIGTSVMVSGQLNPAISKTVRNVLKGKEPGASFIPLENLHGTAVIAIPIKDGAKISGALAFIVKPAISKSSLSLQMWHSLNVALRITDSDGRAVASSDDADVKINLPKVIMDDGVETITNANDENLIVAYAPLAIPGLDLSITAITFEHEALAPLNKVKRIAILALLTATIIAVIIFLLILKNFFSPLEILGEGMKAVASSGATLEKPLNREKAKWAKSLFDLFNNMNLRLGDAIKETKSNYTALARYIDKLEEGIEQHSGAVTGKTKGIDEELIKTIRRQEEEIARLRGKLKKFKKNLATADDMRERVLAMASPETKNRLATATRIAESLYANAPRTSEVAVGALLAELYGLEKTIDRALAGFINGKCFDATSFKEVSLSAMAKEAVKSITSLAQEKNIRLSFKSSAENDITHVNKDLISVAMVKFLENAIMFAQEKGAVEAQVTENDSMVRFEVKNSGEGVEKWQIQKMFDQFHTGEGENYEQTGLFACRVIIKNHDGKIGAESEPGKGTCLFFELPKGHEPVQESLPL